MADDLDLVQLQLTVGESAKAFTTLCQSHAALLDALTELIPGFAEVYHKHLETRRADEGDVTDARELERAQTALRDELERVRNIRKNS